VRQQLGVATTLLVVATLVTGARAVHDAGPPVAHTGGFGEPTCAECHFDSSPREAEALSLGGLPESYRPGELYRLDVAIGDTAARAGGFQLATRVAAGPYAGAPAGTLCAVNARVAVVTDTTTGVQYASHAGAAPADSLRWELMWRAPSGDVGPVIVHVAGNAANDDDSPLGDAILVGAWQMPPARGQESGVRNQGVSGSRCEDKRESFSWHLEPDTP
jgi:hypothetical protein